MISNRSFWHQSPMWIDHHRRFNGTKPVRHPQIDPNFWRFLQKVRGHQKRQIEVAKSLKAIFHVGALTMYFERVFSKKHSEPIKYSRFLWTLFSDVDFLYSKVISKNDKIHQFSKLCSLRSLRLWKTQFGDSFPVDVEFSIWNTRPGNTRLWWSCTPPIFLLS